MKIDIKTNGADPNAKLMAVGLLRAQHTALVALAHAQNTQRLCEIMFEGLTNKPLPKHRKLTDHEADQAALDGLRDFAACMFPDFSVEFVPADPEGGLE